MKLIYFKNTFHYTCKRLMYHPLPKLVLYLFLYLFWYLKKQYVSKTTWFTFFP